MIDSNAIRVNTVPPPLIIETMTVDGVTLHMTNRGEHVTELAPGKKRIEFHYTAVSFINPDKTRFKAILEGYDDHWRDVGNSRSTSYTGLPPGPIPSK